MSDSTNAQTEAGEYEGWPRAARVAIWVWAALGVIGLVYVAARAFGSVSSIGVPLIVALVLGFLFAPLVDWLQNHHIPRGAAAAIVLLGIVLVFVLFGVLVVVSIGSSWGKLSAGLSSGQVAAVTWAKGLHIPPKTVNAVSSSVNKALPSLASGAARSAGSLLAGVAGVLVGIIVALYLCFLMLSSGHEMEDWVGSHLGVPKDVGQEMIDDTAGAIRSYFKGTGIVALVTGIGTAIGLLLVGGPLPLFVGVVTIVFTFVPYVGALISGALAVLLAFGAGGTHLALLVLIVVLFVQIVLQQVVATPIMGHALEMNPVVGFVITILGGIVGGALGAMLAGPALTAFMKVRATIRAYRATNDGVAAGSAGKG